MGFRAVRNLVAHASPQNISPAILQFRLQLPLQAKQNMSLAAPMVGFIADRVFQYSDSNLAEGSGSLGNRTCLASPNSWSDLRPRGRAERNVANYHGI